MITLSDFPQPDPAREHTVQVGDICNSFPTAWQRAQETRERYEYKNPVEIWPVGPDFIRKKVMRVVA